jgi:outer membrane protein assembly factor BamC
MKGMLSLVVASGLMACSGNLQETLEETIPIKQAEYTVTKSLPRLEVPPDLTTPQANQQLEVPGETPGARTSAPDGQVGRKPPVSQTVEVLPQYRGIRVAQRGNQRWLVIQAAPDKVWPKMREFWVDHGFRIKEEDPLIGILETDWAENRADIPKDFIRGWLEKVTTALYTAKTRDKFRVRLERGSDPATTELYLTHRGAEEVNRGETFVWQMRPSDPELEAEMLNRLLVYFGVDKVEARNMLVAGGASAARVQILRDPQGVSYLSLPEDFSSAWQHIGLALDRIGFAVEDRDRARGLYYVRFIDLQREARGEGGGLLSGLTFWSQEKEALQDKYLVSLVAQPGSPLGQSKEAATHVQVLDQSGNRKTGTTVDRILGLLYEELK